MIYPTTPVFAILNMNAGANEENKRNAGAIDKINQQIYATALVATPGVFNSEKVSGQRNIRSSFDGVIATKRGI